MRHTVAVIAAALVVSACAQPADDAGGDIDERDTVTIDGASPAADAPSPDGRADAPSPDGRADPDEGADASDDGSDGTGEDRADETGGVATTIPSRFHGEWNADRSACGTGRSETRLRISGYRIRFYESVGTVQEVAIESDRVVTVTAEYQGEGDTWEDERRLTLSSDGGSLTVSGGGDLVRYRCP